MCLASIEHRHKKSLYCEECAEYVAKKKQKVRMDEKLGEDKGKMSYYRKFRDRTIEVVVGVKCEICGEFTPGTRGKKYCSYCRKRTCIKIPKRIENELKNHSSFVEKPKELMVWSKIVEIRSEMMR